MAIRIGFSQIGEYSNENMLNFRIEF